MQLEIWQQDAKYTRSADAASNSKPYATFSSSINIEVVRSVMKQDYPCGPRQLQRTTFEARPKVYLYLGHALLVFGYKGGPTSKLK